MRRVGRALAAFGLVLLTGLALRQAGWFRPGPAHPPVCLPRQAESRHFQCQPRHWHQFFVPR